MLAAWAMAGVGWRSTHQRVWGTRMRPCTGSKYSEEDRFIFSAGMSDISDAFSGALKPMYTSILSISAASFSARSFSCSSV